MNIKIFLINNGGYHSIRQTQKNFFGEPLVGIGVDSGDLSFPSMEKLACLLYTSKSRSSFMPCSGPFRSIISQSFNHAWWFIKCYS